MTLDCSYMQLSKTCMVRGNRSHYILLQETSQGGLNIYTAFYDIRVLNGCEFNANCIYAVYSVVQHHVKHTGMNP